MNKSVIHPELGELFFPEKDNLIFDHIKDVGVWESDEIEWMRKEVNLGDTCINVGAHIGHHARYLSDFCGKDGKVFAFEPNPKTIDSLIINANASKNKNIFVINSAVGDYVGSVNLFNNDHNTGHSVCYNPYDFQNYDKNVNVDPTSVKITTIDHLFSTKKVDVLIIDTEGFDLFVLSGSMNVIRKNKPKILFEYTPAWLEVLKVDTKKIIKEITDLGYTIRCNVTDKDIEDFFEINEILLDRNIFQCNIFLTPKPMD